MAEYFQNGVKLNSHQSYSVGDTESSFDAKQKGLGEARRAIRSSSDDGESYSREEPSESYDDDAATESVNSLTRTNTGNDWSLITPSPVGNAEETQLQNEVQQLKQDIGRLDLAIMAYKSTALTSKMQVLVHRMEYESKERTLMVLKAALSMNGELSK